MASGRFIMTDDLPPGPRSTQEKREIRIPALSSFDEAEKIIIVETLAALGGNKTKTAEVLKIGRKTLYQKIEQYGIDAVERQQDQSAES